MSKYNRNTVLAGAIAMAFAGGSALAGGPVGVVPFDGDGSGNGFTIDNAGFDATTVETAPCPTGATCTNMTATTAGDILMREVDDGGQRYIQTIFSDLGSSQGDFVYEASVSSGGDENAIAAKNTISGGGIETDVAMYRGAIFGGSAGNNALAVEMNQSISGGFQTMSFETTATPNQGASLFRNGNLQILQPGAGAMQAFGHTVVAGTFQTNSGTLTAGSESVTFAAGQNVSATWIGGTVTGGGPGVILDPGGQTQNHDTRTGDQRDFGLLTYRVGQVTAGNSGGNPNGFVDPQFTQGGTFEEARAFSATGVTDTGLMYNIDHGSFVGGADILTNDWDDTVFGANPY